MTSSLFSLTSFLNDVIQWQHEFWREFIELYESCPCLWDLKGKDYPSKQLKDEKMNVLIEKCKSVFPNANKKFVDKKLRA